MKNKFYFFSITAISVFVFTISSAFGQNSSTGTIPKSKTVHEEKMVKGVKTTEIESEEKYDNKGNVVDEIQYKDGKLDKHYVYEYDQNNNKIKESELFPTGKIKKTSEYKYVNGVKTERLTFDESKKLISRKIYSYYY